MRCTEGWLNGRRHCQGCVQGVEASVGVGGQQDSGFIRATHVCGSAGCTRCVLDRRGHPECARGGRAGRGGLVTTLRVPGVPLPLSMSRASERARQPERVRWTGAGKGQEIGAGLARRPGRAVRVVLLLYRALKSPIPTRYSGPNTACPARAPPRLLRRARGTWNATWTSGPGRGGGRPIRCDAIRPDGPAAGPPGLHTTKVQPGAATRPHGAYPRLAARSAHGSQGRPPARQARTARPVLPTYPAPRTALH